MRRTIITISGTVAGLAAVLAFKSHPVTDVSAVGTPATSPSPTLAAGAGRADGTSGAGGAGMAGRSASKGARSATASASKPASAATRTVTGTVANTQEGPMQVQLVLTGKQITKVNILQRTNDGQESNQIDSFAIPKLTSETLTAQSARIDAVSGATYTSQGYIQSLQSALDQANA